MYITVRKIALGGKSRHTAIQSRVNARASQFACERHVTNDRCQLRHHPAHQTLSKYFHNTILC